MMSGQLNVDRESFQTLLANAFAIQQSGVDSKSLCAFVEVQRSMGAGNVDLDREIGQIAECTRNVAKATGVAIARLEADRLVYFAGSGNAVAYIGRNLIANLNGSARNTVRAEILCVEDAQTDRRVEAAVCRQFGAKSLLILPIDHERAVIGVLQILFSEPHTFQTGEVLAYRLLAGLVAEVMVRKVNDRKGATEPATVQPATVKLLPQMEMGPVDARWAGAGKDVPSVEYAVATAESSLHRVPAPKKTIAHWRNRGFLGGLGRSLAPVLVVLFLMLEVWITVSHRRVSSRGGWAGETTKETLPVSSVSSAPTRASGNAEAQPENKRVEMKAATFKRIVVGPHEIDYVADDVTIRHFDSKPGPPQLRTVEKELPIGEDVTVRYFVQRPGAKTSQPSSTGAGLPERSTATSK